MLGNTLPSFLLLTGFVSTSPASDLTSVEPSLAFCPWANGFQLLSFPGFGVSSFPGFGFLSLPGCGSGVGFGVSPGLVVVTVSQTAGPSRRTSSLLTSNQPSSLYIYLLN